MTLPIRAIVLTSLFGALAAAPAAAQTPAQPECSAVIKNPACTVTINRESPSTPQPFLMTGHATITISIRKRPFDKIEVNSVFADVVPVDPLEAILKAFAPSFPSIVHDVKTSADATIASSKEKDVAPTPIRKSAFELDLEWIDARQLDAQRVLAEAKETLDCVGAKLAVFADQPAGTWTSDTLQPAAKSLAADLRDGEAVSVPTGIIAALGDAVTAAQKTFAGLGKQTSPPDAKELARLAKLLNGVDAHQALLESSAKSLVGSQDGLRAARTLLEAINASDVSRAKSLLSTKKIETSPQGPARSVKSTVTLTELLSKDKTDLGTISASWNSTPWEVSAGTVFSTRPITSYGVANSVITESNTRPMVVPFALAHYNLWETTAGRYRVALLASGGMGVNTNTKSADFGYGFSLSYRGVYLSGLNHKGRETVLAGALATGQTVASSVTTAPTELKWKSKFRLGIALTLRVPF